jgi:hypothetical protein
MSTPTSPNDPDRNDDDRPVTPDDGSGSQPPRYGDQPQYGQSAPQYGQQSGDQPAGYGGDVRYGQGQPGTYGAGSDYGNAPPTGYGRSPSNGLGIAALVFGIVAILGSWIPFVNIVSMVLAIIGIIVGIMALRKVKRGEATNRGMSLIGIGLSVVALVLSLVITIAVTRFVGSNMDEIANCTDPALSAEEQQACLEELGNN